MIGNSLSYLVTSTCPYAADDVSGISDEVDGRLSDARRWSMSAAPWSDALVTWATLGMVALLGDGALTAVALWASPPGVHETWMPMLALLRVGGIASVVLSKIGQVAALAFLIDGSRRLGMPRTALGLAVASTAWGGFLVANNLWALAGALIH